MQKIEVFYCEIIDLNGYKNRIITTDEKKLSNFRRNVSNSKAPKLTPSR